MKRYIGITIGPIASTMNFVSSPAALWASSYLFSSICRKICEKLISSYGIAKEDILSPYFDEKASILNRNDGIGLFHDRIIFESDSFDVSKLNDIREVVIKEISDEFEISNDYLKEYILIVGTEFKSDEPLLDSGERLDSLELSAPFVIKEKSNPIIQTFAYRKETEEESKSKKIKEIARKKLHIDKDKWQLLRNNEQIKDLGMIASSTNADEKFKINKYYAVIRSDGDNMSKIIASLTEKDAYREFSRICLSYCAEVADIVGGYGGFTVYAGGDDLLAVVPCENDKVIEGKDTKRTVFNLASDINGCFKDKFKKYINQINAKNSKLEKHGKELIPVPSLSFGIFISYNKFPLYEALQESANMLFEVSKSEGRKNCVTICVQKHSGQSMKLILPNQHMDNYLKLQDSVLCKREDTEEKFLLSASQKVVMFRTLFDYALEDTQINNVFTNTFDADDQKAFQDDLDTIKEFLKESLKISTECKKKIEATDENNEFSSENTAVLNAVLSILKFCTEKGDEES